MLSRASNVGVAAALVLSLGVAACGDDEDAVTDRARVKFSSENSRVEITIGSKEFTEERILGEIYAQGLEAAGYTVKTDLTLPSEQAALQAMESGQISGYAEYIPTVLTSFFNVPAEDLPHDSVEAATLAQERLETRGLVGFKPAPFDRAFTVGLRVPKADFLVVEKLSDLEGKSGDLTLAGSPECARRLDCLGVLEQGYGLKFRQYLASDPERRFEVLDEKEADLSIVSTTDAPLFYNPSIYTSLDDDQGVFPAGNPIFIAPRRVVNQAGPDFKATIEKVQGGLDLNGIQELNARVEIERADPADVAKEYLQEIGYLPE